LIKRIGKITGVSGNMIEARTDFFIIQNEVAYILHGSERLKAEVIRVRGKYAEMQVYENTSGIKIGEDVEFIGELLSVELGPARPDLRRPGEPIA
jgi:V/A-type H+-transporting ATPase subunit A